MEKWIAVFGRMDMIHSDRGGEFCCEELADIAEYIGVRSSFTAASSPHQNGVNERNHAVCDKMMEKMRMQDPSLSAQVALTWALVAKNSLENVSGFSPFQLVFGKAPSLPSVYTAGPPGFEEVVMEKAVADHINALFLAREAYVQGESDKTLKAALKQRIYKRGHDIEVGDWIYFNQRGKWQGPVKVTTKDGKSLFVIRGGKLITINIDHAQLAKFEGELKPVGVSEVVSDASDEINNIDLTDQKKNVDFVPDDSNALVEEKVIQKESSNNPSPSDANRDAETDSGDVADIKKGSIVCFQKSDLRAPRN